MLNCTVYGERFFVWYSMSQVQCQHTGLCTILTSHMMSSHMMSSHDVSTGRYKNKYQYIDIQPIHSPCSLAITLCSTKDEK